jgi:Holliday junction resolvase RusA-like endonuclease
MIELHNDPISLVLNCQPMACPRPRVSGRFAYMPSSYIKWKKDQKVKIQRQTDMRNIADPVFLVLTFVYMRPKALSRQKDPRERIYKHNRPDIDNLSKSVMDLLQDCKVIKDDSQVVGITASKWYGALTPDKIYEQSQIKIDIYPLKR